MTRKLKKRQREAIVTLQALRQQGYEILLWATVYYTPNDICCALEDAGWVWASNFQRWMKQEELGL
jgi:hypothetical protein